MPEFPIGYSPFLDANFVRRVRPLAERISAEEDLAIRVRSAPPRDLMQQLLDGSIRACFVESPFEDDAVLSERLFDEPLILALPSGHPLCSKRSIDPRRLSAQRMVWLSRDAAPQYGRYLSEVCERAGFWPQIVEEASTTAECLDLVAERLGVAFVRASSPRVPGVVYRPIDGAAFRTATCVAYRRDLQSKALGRIVALAKSFI